MSPIIPLALAALPAALAATWDVTVGAGGQLAYNPPFVNAAPGDIVNFVFHPKNHTATQSSFDAPCVPLAGGQDSGFKPVADESGGLPNFQFHVQDTNPTWFFCQQTGHCGKGMVFAINAPADPNPHSFKAFQDSAIAKNGTTSSAPVATATATDTFVTPPPPQWETATATVTWQGSTYTTVYSSYAGSPPPTPAAQPADHKIVVGADGNLEYSPSNIQAAIGDTVTFEFRPKNHTVTQSSFSAPCQPLAVSTGNIGFASGFTPVAANATTFPTFQIKINDTAPIWGYCGQTNHCGSGMVFSINAVESGPNNFNAFKALAMRINGSTTTVASSTGTGASSPSSSAGSNSRNNSAPGALSQVGYTSSLALLVLAFISLW